MGVPFLAGAAAGAVAGKVAEEAYEHGRDALSSAVGIAPESQHDGIETAMLVQIVQRIERAIAASNALTDITETVLLQQPSNGVSIPVQVSLRGRRHLSLLAATPFMLAVTVPAIGSIVFNMTAGWNAIDPPENAQLTIAAADSHTSLSVVLRYGQHSLQIAGA